VSTKASRTRSEFLLLLRRYKDSFRIPSIQQLLGIKVKVAVREGKIEQALRVLKRKMQSEGIYREMRENEHFEKPSEKRKRKQAEARRRHLKELRKREDLDFGRVKKKR
jgi:ribosomal protein S21